MLKKLVSRPVRNSILASLAIALIACGAVISAWSSGPDFDLELKREIVSELPWSQVVERVENMDLWKEWGYWLVRAEMETPQISLLRLESPIPPAGEHIRVITEFKGRARRRNELRILVVEHIPGKTLTLELVSETRPKLSRMLSPLRWHIELSPAPNDRARITAVFTARTTSGRGRVMGKLSPKILMHQSFFGDLERLGGKEPIEGMSLSPGG